MSAAVPSSAAAPTCGAWSSLFNVLMSQALASRLDPAAEGPDDAALVTAARGGDPSAFEQLYQRYAAAAYRRLTRLIGPVAAREDVLQEVFVALFKAIPRFRGDARLSTYLYRIVANKAHDHLERRRRDKHTVPIDEAALALPSAAMTPEGAALAAEDALLLWRCLERITPKKRIAFVLRVVEGLSLREIADQVGARVDTVAQRIRHAKNELIGLVADQRGESP